MTRAEAEAAHRRALDDYNDLEAEYRNTFNDRLDEARMFIRADLAPLAARLDAARAAFEMARRALLSVKA